MNRSVALIVRMFCFSAALTSLLALPARAQGARAFAGSYQLTNVVEHGSQVRVTMVLTLMNRSNADVKGGIVAVMNSQPTPALLGSFSAIKELPHMNQVTVSHTLSISAAEYAQWQQGHEPQLQLLCPSVNENGEASAISADVQAHKIVLPAKATN